jgi:hypothetical protein
LKANVLKALVTFIVAAHLIGNLWHGDAHTILEIALPPMKTAFIVAVILVGPVAGAVLAWTRYTSLGYWLVGGCLTGSVLFSVYHHYVMISIDNVDHLPPGTPEGHAHFSNSAEFIALVALIGALRTFYAAGTSSNRTPTPQT